MAGLHDGIAPMVHDFMSPTPAERKFTDMKSEALRDIVYYEVEALKMLLAFDRSDVPSFEEFKPTIRESQLLVHRIMVELTRRSDLSAGDMILLLELAKSVLPSKIGI